MHDRSSPFSPSIAARAAILAVFLAVPAVLPAATRDTVTPDDAPWPLLREGREVSPDPACPLDLVTARPGEYRRQITGNGWVLDACGILHRTGTVTGPLPGESRISARLTSPNATHVTIDSIATWNYYSDTYSPFNGIETLGSATRYYLSDGSSWPSGAGYARITRARLLSSQVNGDSVSFVLIPPSDSVLYQQTDYSFGDHSSQGTLTCAGPMVIRARIGDTEAVMDGLASVRDNDITSYGEPAFNYFSAVVGSVVPYHVHYRLSGGTWSASTLDGTVSYSLTGLIDFAHPVSSPALKSLAVSGPSQMPDQSTAQYAAVATYEGGTTRDVTSLATWSVTPASLATIAAGQLVTQTMPRDTVTLVLRASYTTRGVTKVTEKPVLCRRDLFTPGTSAWPTFQANERHDGYLPVSLHVAEFKRAWSVTLGGGQPLNPVSAADGHVFCSVIRYFGSGDMFFALDARDGHTMWSKTSTAFSVNPPAAAYGNAYVQTCNNGGDTWLFAFDGATGNQVFKSPFGAQWERYYAPTPYKGRLYIDGGTYGGMYQFDALSGGQGWFLGLPQYDQWTPSVDSLYVYGYLGEYSPGLYVAHRENAAQAFMIPDPSFDWDGWSMFGAAVLGSQGDVLAHHDGRLIRFDLASRSISWQIPTGFDQPSLAKGSIYVVRSGALNVLNERTGSPQWTWSPPHGQLTGTVIVTDTHVFTASADSVYAVDLATHQRAWGYAASGALAIGNGQLYIASTTGKLDAVNVGGTPVVVHAEAGPDTTIDCTGGDARGVAVRLDGRRSTGSGPLTFRWSAAGVTFDDATSPTPTGWFQPGETLVFLTVSTGGQQARDSVRVSVADHAAPTLSVELSPNSLWPPDHRFVPVSAKVVASDGCDPSPHWKLVSVTENDLGVGSEVPASDADLQGAALGTADADVLLRAERLGEGDGRMYTMCFEAMDASGNRRRACASVTVPHDQSGRATLVPSRTGSMLTLYGAKAGDLRQLDVSSIVVRSGNTDVLVPSTEEAAFSDVDHDGVLDATLDMKSVPSTVASGAVLWVHWNVGAHSSLAALSFASTGVDDPAGPAAFAATVTPNPGRAGTTLHYTLPRAGHVRVQVFDVAGRLVTTLVDGDRGAGAFEASLAGLATGHARLYLYSIEWGGERRNGKFVLMN